jgi:hypothetical protein
METLQKTPTARLRATAVAMVMIVMALAASLFVTSSPADAKQVERSQELAATTQDGDADVDPWTQFCLDTAEAKDFVACVGERVEDDGGSTATIAVKTRDDRNGDNGWLCPAGTIATAFQMPIYDDDGLFVIGYETVWYCIDADTRPAG